MRPLRGPSADPPTSRRHRASRANGQRPREETELQGEQREHAETAISLSRSLLTIINDTLDFSKIEAGKLALGTQPFDPRTVVGDVGRVLNVSASNKAIELSFDLSDDTPATLVGDSGRLRQILLKRARAAGGGHRATQPRACWPQGAACALPTPVFREAHDALARMRGECADIETRDLVARAQARGLRPVPLLRGAVSIR